MSRTPPLRGRGLRLEPLATSHAAEMEHVLADAGLYEYIGGSPPSRAELDARYARQVAGPRGDAFAWHTWVVRLADDGCAVGQVQATVHGDDGVAELAWTIGAPWQGRGLASDAAALVVEFVVASGVGRVIAHIHPEHLASQRVAARLGLVPTGRTVDGEVEWEARHGIRGR
ncbi:MAG TPA: GNAT family N-acetyltransferase [Ornithinibacter sp.]|nr:GNAT family N-acetyltransferase [Ornithinibacter sp.]